LTTETVALALAVELTYELESLRQMAKPSLAGAHTGLEREPTHSPFLKTLEEISYHSTSLWDLNAM
jgi:hypothetical protein